LTSKSSESKSIQQHKQTGSTQKTGKEDGHGRVCTRYRHNREVHLDHWQAAELISSFLSIRGYGVSNHAARGAAARIEAVRCSLKFMQEELEKLALVM
jgi:hypothetical protein